MLKVRNISKTYKNGFVGLHPVNLEFHAGSFIALLGKSGAGKSTLLRCLNHLNEPSTGFLELQGVGRINNRSLLRRHRRQTSMIFQQHQLIARHTAMKNVLTARVSRYSWIRGMAPFPRADRLFACQCLERVGLLSKAMERVDNLSGGQQQRVGIARALAQEPRIILADEPVASLDPGSSRAVLSQLRRICREDGLLMVVSLHQVELACEYADRIIALSDGHIVFDGSANCLDQNRLEQIYGCSDIAATESWTEQRAENLIAA